MNEDMDFLIEGVLVKNFFTFIDDWPVEPKKADPQELDKDMITAIQKSRSMGETDAAIEENIRTNLMVYGFDDKTFPIERWLAAAQERENGG